MCSVCKEFMNYASKTHAWKGCVLFVACCLCVPFPHQELQSPEIYLANLLYLTSTLCLYISLCLPHRGGSYMTRHMQTVCTTLMKHQHKLYNFTLSLSKFYIRRTRYRSSFTSSGDCGIGPFVLFTCFTHVRAYVHVCGGSM